jgi:hypothetical protein
VARAVEVEAEPSGRVVGRRAVAADAEAALHRAGATAVGVLDLRLRDVLAEQVPEEELVER